jgi:hypothetical protein
MTGAGVGAGAPTCHGSVANVTRRKSAAATVLSTSRPRRRFPRTDELAHSGTTPTMLFLQELSPPPLLLHLSSDDIGKGIFATVIIIVSNKG